VSECDLDRAATRGEPSYVWRAGQERRLRLILEAAGDRARGRILDDGCGVGQYLAHLAEGAELAVGLEFDAQHASAAAGRGFPVTRVVNYLPRQLRDRLAPHVRVYRRDDLDMLLEGLPVRVVERRIIFGAYDNIIARWPRLGRILRAALHYLERTPLRVLGLSHFWVVERE